MSNLGYYTGQEIIDEALIGVGDANRDKYLEAAMYFGRGYREFQLFHAGGEVKEDWQPITAVNTVNFPKDAMRILEVGVLSDGEFFSFTKDNGISGVSNPIDISRNTDKGEDVTLDKTPTSGYGTKGHNVEYYYKEERDKRRLLLSRMAIDKVMFADRTEVLFKYVSDGINDLSQVFITSDAANLLIAYIEYKMVSSRPDLYDARYRMEKKEEYREQAAMYDALEMPSIFELEDIIYENSGQNVRRK
jgi:hypothetical protein